jgi:peptide/nickel transport system substrate-binding protein
MSPVGTGAYKFDSMTTMKNITLSKNSSWFKGLSYIDRINAVIIPKEDAQLYAFNQGQIDLINTDVVDWEKYGVTKDRNIDEYTTNYYEFIGVNFNKSLLSDKLVRQALAYAIPREKIVAEIYLDHAIVADTPINPKSWLSNKQIKYKLDNAKAKELLNQAGWIDSNGNGILDKSGQEFKFTLLVNSENLQRVEVANTIKNSLKEIGIDMSIDTQNFENYQQKLTTKSFEAFLGGWRLSSIPDLTFAFHSSNIATGNNFVSYNNETMNILLETAASSVNEASMQQAYKSLDTYMTEELPYISLYFRNAAVLTEGSVKGELNSDGNNIYRGIKDWFIYKD